MTKRSKAETWHPKDASNPPKDDPGTPREPQGPPGSAQDPTWPPEPSTDLRRLPGTHQVHPRDPPGRLRCFPDPPGDLPRTSQRPQGTFRVPPDSLRNPFSLNCQLIYQPHGCLQTRHYEIGNAIQFPKGPSWGDLKETNDLKLAMRTNTVLCAVFSLSYV